MSQDGTLEQTSVLQHKTLEALVFQWDGTREHGMAVTAELMRELPPLDAVLAGSEYRAGVHVALQRSSQSVSVDDGRTLSVRIGRLADETVNALRLHPHEWLVIWLFHGNLYGTEVFSRERGEILFAPVRPIITLRPRGTS